MPQRSDADVCNIALKRAGTNMRIGSLIDTSPAAQACNDIYAEARRCVLNECRWKFAIKRIQLAVLAGNAYDPAVAYAKSALVTFDFVTYRSLQAGNLNNEPDLNSSAAWWQQVTRDGYAYVYSVPDDLIDPISVWPKATPLDLFTFPNLRNPHSYERVPYTLENANDGTDGQVLLTDAQDVILRGVFDVLNAGAFTSTFVEVLTWYLAEPLALTLKGDEKKAAYCKKRYDIELGNAISSELRDEQLDSEPTSEFEDARTGCVRG